MSGPRYSIIPADAVTDRRLEPVDLRVLCLLGRHTNDAGWCSRSQVKMARELGIGRATLQRGLKRLIECGYVEQRAEDPPRRRRPGAFLPSAARRGAAGGTDRFR